MRAMQAVSLLAALALPAPLGAAAAELPSDKPVFLVELTRP